VLIRVLALNEDNARQFAERLYPTASIGSPVAVGRPTSAAACQFHRWLRHITQRKHHENITIR
jgi:hypothetical protein